MTLETLQSNSRYACDFFPLCKPFTTQVLKYPCCYWMTQIPRCLDEWARGPPISSPYTVLCWEHQQDSPEQWIFKGMCTLKSGGCIPAWTDRLGRFHQSGPPMKGHPVVLEPIKLIGCYFPLHQSYQVVVWTGQLPRNQQTQIPDPQMGLSLSGPGDTGATASTLLFVAQ